MNARPALFPEPPPNIPALSTALSGPELRLRRGESAKWTPVRAYTLHCEECAHLQHELRGEFGPRRQVKYRRNTPTGLRLNLCRGHAMAWRTRDEADAT